MEPIKNGLKCWLEGADVTNSSTIWKDRSGNNNNFSITGSLTTENNMAVFSGSQYAKISNLNIEHGTIEITVAYDSGGTSSHGFGSWESNKYKFTFGSYSIHMRKKSNPVSGAGSWDFRISQNIKYGDVATYGLSYNESTFSIFYNGKIISEGVSSEIPNITSFYLGLKSDDNTKHAGKIKSLRIYNRKLEYHEILANYQYELLDRNNNLYVNDNNLPKIVEKLSDASNIKITGNEYGNRVQTVIDKIVKKADNVTKAINQEVVNNTHSFKVGKGNNVDVSTDVQDSFSEIAMKGQTYQNLFVNCTNSKCLNNYQHWKVVGENTFEVNADGTNKFLFIKKENMLLKPSTQYTFIFEVLNNTLVSSSDSAYSFTIFGSSGSFKGGVILTGDKLKTTTFLKTTIPDLSTATHGFDSYINNNAVSGNLKVRLTVLEGDHTNNPNLPSYFEGIVGVGDKSKNLFDKNKELVLGAYFKEDGSIQRGSFSKTNQNFIDESYYEIKSNHLTWSGDSSYAMHPLGICFYTKEKQFIQRIEQTNMINIPISSDAKYYRIKGDYSRIDVLQLEENSKATIYKPYHGNYKLEIESVGKNLLNPLISYPFNINKNRQNDGALLSVVKVKPNTKYTMSVNRTENKGRIIAKFSNRLIHSSEVSSYNQGYVFNFLRDNYANGRQFEYTINSGDKITFTTLDDCNYIYLNIDGAYGTFNTGDIVTTINNVQIEEGTIATSYEPYKQDKLEFVLDEPLMKLPNGVYDEITQDGKLIRRIGKIILDGSDDEKWWIHNDEKFTKRFRLSLVSNSNQKSQTAGWCDSIPFYPNKSWQTDRELIELDTGAISIRKPFNTVIDFKSWLKTNPVTLYYELSNPIITDLSNNQIKLFKDGHLTFNTVVAPESTHIVQLNKSAQIQNTIKQSQLLDNKITVLENNYDSLMLSTMSTLNDLELDYTLK